MDSPSSNQLGLSMKLAKKNFCQILKKFDNWPNTEESVIAGKG